MIDTPDTPERSSRRLYLLLAGVAVLLAGGIFAVLYFGSATPPPPPPPVVPPPPVEDPLPTSPALLLRDLSASTAAGNRPRLIRLLSDDWAGLVLWADGEVLAVAEAKRKAVEAVRAAIGEPSARLVRELKDLPAPWPLFAGVEWSRGKVVEKTFAIAVGETTFETENPGDGSYRLRPGSTAVLDDTRADIDLAIAPLKETYRRIEEQATAGRLASESFPDVLQSIRQAAMITAHLSAKPR